MIRIDRRVCRRALLALLIAAVALGGCTFPQEESDDRAAPSPATSAGTPPAGTTDPATESRFARFYQQKATWSSCGDGFQCAKVTVPIDWSQPSGDTLEMSVNRLPSSGDRIGSLMVNPGGPGASGLQFARAARQVFGPAILDHFDVVGFDPRGVGESDPVKCLPDAELDAYVAEDGTPDTPAEVKETVAETRHFVQACQRNTGPLLKHVDTLSVVKDMDVLRAVLGENTLTYQGLSYGTYLGAWYAQTFPWRVGRLVLDGAIDPSLTSAQYVAGQAEGFHRALRAFVQDCQSQPECPLRGSVDDGLAQLGQLIAAADQSPLRTNADRELTQSLMVTGIAMGLYSVQLWPALTIGLSRAISGDGSGLLRLADQYLERDQNGHFGQTISANPAMYCLDVPEKRTPEQIAADAVKLNEQFPPLGGAIGWGALGCAEWPIPAVMPRQKLRAEGAAPILVVGTVNDPATPYEWAESLASQLSSGRLVTWEGSQHTAYGQGSKCIDGAVEDYLLSGTLPAADTRCS